MKPLRIPSHFWYAVSRVDPSPEKALEIAKDIITTVMTKAKGPTLPDPVADADVFTGAVLRLDIDDQTYIDFRNTLPQGNIPRDISRFIWTEFSKRYPDYDASVLSGLIPKERFESLAFYYPSAAMTIERAINRSHHGVCYLRLNAQGCVTLQEFFEHDPAYIPEKDWVNTVIRHAEDDARKEIGRTPLDPKWSERDRLNMEHRQWIFEAMAYGAAVLYVRPANDFSQIRCDDDMWYQIRNWRMGLADIIARINQSFFPEDPSRLTVIIDSPDIWSVMYYGEVRVTISDDKTQTVLGQLNSIFKSKE